MSWTLTTSPRPSGEGAAPAWALLGAGWVGGCRRSPKSQLTPARPTRPRRRGGARVVLVVGDVSGKRRADAGVLARVLEAILENGKRVSQMVLVSPLGGGGGGGGFLGGGKAKSGGRLSALEQQVVESGVPYLIVRAASPDKVTDRYGGEASIVAGPPGSLPASLQASRAQVAEAVVAAMKATRGGGSAIIEVGADPRAPEQPLARLIAQVREGWRGVGVRADV